MNCGFSLSLLIICLCHLSEGAIVSWNHIASRDNSSSSDVYVSTTGSDDNACTSDLPCLSIGRAIASVPVTVGEINVHLSSGSFTDSMSCNFSICNLIGEGSTLTTLKTTSSILVAGNATLSGITIRDYNNADGYFLDFGPEISVDHAHWNMTDVIFSGVSLNSIFNASNTNLNQTITLDRVSLLESTCSLWCLSAIVDNYHHVSLNVAQFNATLVTASALGGLSAFNASYTGSIDLVFDEYFVWKSTLRFGIVSLTSAGGSINAIVRNSEITNNSFAGGGVFGIQLVAIASVNLTVIDSIICNNPPISFGAIDTYGSSTFTVINGSYDGINYPARTKMTLTNLGKCPVTDKIIDDSPPPSDSKSALIGGVVGGAIALAIIAVFIVFFILFYKRMQARKARDAEGGPMADTALVPVGSDIPILTGITLGNRLGGGNFGDVYMGIWNGTKVALKKPKNEEAFDDFMKEASILTKVNHPNCVQFLGVCKIEAVQYIVMEYLSRGDLVNVLKEDRKTIDMQDLLDMCEGMCRGLAYLEKNNIIHRDVALRNLLVTLQDGSYLVKVSDFGMSRAADEGQYSPNSDTKFAMKWTAADVILGGPVTSKSDVWSFGIACWEIFTYGQRPYDWLSNKEARVEIPKGEQLPKPDDCPQEYFDVIMRSCWKLDPNNRPSFEELVRDIQAYRRRSLIASGKADDLEATEVEAPKVEVTKNKNGKGKKGKAEVTSDYVNIKGTTDEREENAYSTPISVDDGHEDEDIIYENNAQIVNKKIKQMQVDEEAFAELNKKRLSDSTQEAMDSPYVVGL